MMTGKGVGEDKAVEFPTFYFLDGDQDFFVDKERGAENGRIKVDGYEFDINDNKLSDVIPGVTLDLRSAMPGREINISVSEDKEVITGKIKKFVDQMNGVFQFIQAQNKLDKDSDTSKTLGGDALLRDIENRFRNILQGQVFGVQGSVKYLSEVGISFNRSGMLNFDEEKFNAIVSKNLPAVTEFFIGDGMAVGMVPQLKNALNQMLDPTSGPLLQRERGLKSKINQFDDQIANKERILAQKEVQLKNQFARLEETMSRLKAQGSYLQARMGGGGDMGFNLKGG
jgi:flagellar hook-associated protein 2